ncbi:MAG: nucleotide exchange factor GrpE [Candidatus Acidiferrales bacterium]
MSSHKRSPNRGPEETVAAPTPDPSAEQSSAVESQSPETDQILKLQAEKQELTNTLLRRQADFDNFKKRVEKERSQERHRGAEALVEQLIGVLDAFDRALSGNHDPAFTEYKKGFELIRGQIWNTLSKAGLQRIDAVGKEFDPNLHHAIEKVETADHAENVVVDELAPGYLFHGRVLRPAMVRIATGAPN